MYLGWDIGIKNLAYCLIDYINHEFVLVDWGIINLMVHTKSNEKCTITKKNGKVCHKNASYYNKDAPEVYYCGSHYAFLKENKDTLEKINDKVLCNKCNKLATRYNSSEELYFCGKHGKNIDPKHCDTITQTKATKMPLYTLGKILYRTLDEYPEFLKAKYICIENQPANKNPTMKSIQIMLYSYFIMKSVHKLISINDIVLMSAKNKLKVYKNEYGPIDNKILSIKNKYTRYKKMAVATTHLYLNNEYSDTVWVDYFHNNKSKNDDLADAYLMTRFYISKILNLHP